MKENEVPITKNHQKYYDRFHTPRFTTLQQNGTCKMCSKTIPKRSERVIRLETTYRSCSLIILCVDCVRTIYNLTQEENENEDQ